MDTGDQVIGGRSGVSIGEIFGRDGSTGDDIDATGSLNAAGSAGSAATVMHVSAQLTPNDFAGQQGHFGACPWWLIEAWQWCPLEADAKADVAPTPPCRSKARAIRTRRAMRNTGLG